jgi:hypothetical protein
MLCALAVPTEACDEEPTGEARILPLTTRAHSLASNAKRLMGQLRQVKVKKPLDLRLPGSPKAFAIN